MISIAVHLFLFFLLLPILLLSRLPRMAANQHIHHILAIGTFNGRVIVITGPQKIIDGYPLLYNLSIDALSDTKGQIYLKGSLPTSMSQKYAIRRTAPGMWSHPIDHAITYWDSKSGRFYFLTQTMMPSGQSAILYFDLLSNYMRTPNPRDLKHYHEVWISSSESMTFYFIKDSFYREVYSQKLRRPTRIAKVFAFNVYAPLNLPLLFENFNVTTPYYTICKFTDDPEDRIIYLSKYANCPYPVFWKITSGYVDAKLFILIGEMSVYYFDRRLFEKAPVKGEYTERGFGEFFYLDHTVSQPDTGRRVTLAHVAFPKWALVPISVAIIVIVCVIFFIVYCFCDCDPEDNDAVNSDNTNIVKGSTETSRNSPPPPKTPKKASPPKKSKKKGLSKKSKKSNKTKKTKQTGKSKGPSRKTKKSDKKSNKSKKKSDKAKTGSDLLPHNLSDAMASLKTNDADDVDQTGSGTSKGNSQRTDQSKSGKGKQSVKTKKSGKPPPIPLGVKLAKAAGRVPMNQGKSIKLKPPSSKQPMLKISGKMAKSLKQPPSFKGVKSKKTMLKSGLPDEGASLGPGLEGGREKSEGTMRGGSGGE